MTLANHFGAALMRAVWALSASLPPERASAVGAAVARSVGPHVRKHKMLVDNLRIAFPEWTTTKVESVARASWAQLGRVIAEFPHFSALFDQSPGRVEMVDSHGALGRAAAGEPTLFVGGHFANWELLAGAIVRHAVPLTVVHAARANPAIEALLEKRRQALGCEFLEQGESVHAMLRQIRAGRSIGVLVDQRYNKGAAVPFFGRPALAAMAPAMLAARFGMPFVPIRAERLADCRFRITCEAPLVPDYGLRKPRAIAHDLMARLHARYEAWIRERPDEWLCIKRRWPKQKRSAVAADVATAAALIGKPAPFAVTNDARQRRAS